MEKNRVIFLSGGASAVDRRRVFLQTHRAFRANLVPWPAALAGFVVAAIVSTSMFAFGSRLLTMHEMVRRGILTLAGIPLAGTSDFMAYSGISAKIAITPLASYSGEPWKPMAVCAAVAAILLIPFLRSGFSRSLVIFAWMLLVLSAGKTAFQPESQGEIEFFVSFWLRCEFVLWILVPLLVSSVTGLTEPSWIARTLWTAVAPLYAILWSAVRLAFCAGILFFSGPALMLFLWSAFGLSIELLSLCTLYSLVVFRSGRTLRIRDVHSSVRGH